MLEIPVPEIDYYQLPEDERENIRILNENIQELKEYIDNFAAALTLFNVCEAQGGSQTRSWHFDAWIYVALRDGAMTIYHFGKTLVGAKTTLQMCPALLAMSDRAKLRSSGRMFEEAFKGHVDMRDAIAHSGEISHNPMSRSRNMFSGSYDGPAIQIQSSSGIIKNMLAGHRYTTLGFDGKLVSYDISAETLSHLVAIYNEFCSALPYKGRESPETAV